MLTNISKTPEIKARLKRERKSRTLDTPEDVATILLMNDQLEKFRKEFLEKDRNSNIKAENMN